MKGRRVSTVPCRCARERAGVGVPCVGGAAAHCCHPAFLGAARVFGRFLYSASAPRAEQRAPTRGFVSSLLSLCSLTFARAPDGPRGSRHSLNGEVIGPPRLPGAVTRAVGQTTGVAR